MLNILYIKDIYFADQDVARGTGCSVGHGDTAGLAQSPRNHSLGEETANPRTGLKGQPQVSTVSALAAIVHVKGLAGCNALIARALPVAQRHLPSVLK
jgi:hypothetical protein